jgi:tetraacyldisaccharide 4'-kinase
MSFSERLQKAWYAPGKDWLSIALLDVSWLYGGMLRLRRKLYARGIFKSTRLGVPVIVVGNVVAGGAGKTPVVIEIAKQLAQHGYLCGIVSRGYGRKTQGVLEVLSVTPVADSGDEPALIKAAQNAPIFVAEKRAEAAQALLAVYPEVNVILCDDGLQHLALQRDMEICVFDERGVGNGRLQPAGPLREHWPRATDFILHRGGFESGFQASYTIDRRLADHALQADGTRISWTELAAKSPIALAGIAQPEAFFSMLRERGLTPNETIALPDHYDFNSYKPLWDGRRSLICTEKDAIKLWRAPLAQQHDIYAVPLIVQLPQAFSAALLEQLSSLQSATASNPAPADAPVP